jgi:2-keto-4-pentenoate hydratase/2-oxohepta-3-ene-1,7-dioic acid hydratase in catechol pathway
LRIGNLAGRLTLFVEGGAIDVERASNGRFGSDPQLVYERWAEFSQWAAGASGEPVAFAIDDLRAPVPRPSQIFAIGANYRDHAAEGGVDVPEWPMVFAKYVSSFMGPTGEIALPGPTVDWEAELVVVIGRRARNVSSVVGWDHVAGLTVGQDMSERTVQLRGPMPQMSMGKSFPGFSPTGPFVVTPDEFDDPDSLELGCSVNGEVLQQASTADLVFSVPVLIAELSAVLTLEPGDVIFTGTPAGVGLVRTPPRFLRPGDALTTYVEGIGEMRHTFLAGPTAVSDEEASRSLQRLAGHTASPREER